MSNTSKASAVTPPVVGENIWGLAATDLSPTTYIAVPAGWKDCILRFEAHGEDFYFVFGDATLTTVSATAVSTIASNAISAQGSVGYHIEADTYVDVDTSLVDLKFLARIALLAAASTAGAVLRITRMSGYVR